MHRISMGRIQTRNSKTCSIDGRLHNCQSPSFLTQNNTFRSKITLPFASEINRYSIQRNLNTFKHISPASRSHSPSHRTITLSAATNGSKPQVVLTRELGKNKKLQKILESKGISCLEMPLIETSRGPDRAKLSNILKEKSTEFDWVCITSPEAASLFVEGWKDAGKPSVRIAVVGEGTGKVLLAYKEEMLIPKFAPSVANAEHFGPELPFITDGTRRILYPASNKASSVLQEGLLARGFDVLRLNTYDTVPVSSLEDTVLKQAREASVIAIASPSAVKAWIGFAGEETALNIPIAAIGSTSARAAEKAGLKKVYYSEKPGLDTFAETIVRVLSHGGVEK